MCWNAKYAILIFASTIITYCSGIVLEKFKKSSIENKKVMKKMTIVICVLINIGILFYFKYFNFFLDSLGVMFNSFGIDLSVKTFDIILPVGISFYTFQALSYTFDVYFAGYSIISRDTALMLGIHLMENFESPYLAVSVAEFWRRWHISLTTWFKDYIYIPLWGSRKGTFRKYINKMIVFLISGLWHGADFSFVIWGAKWSISDSGRDALSF